MKSFTLLLLLFSLRVIAQPWNYNFGTGTGSLTSGESLTFLPDPESGGGADARVRVGTAGGSFNLENQTISFGSESYLRGIAPTSTSVNKFSIYDYTSGTSFTIRFLLRLGASDGSGTGASDGYWHFFIGDGSNYSNSSLFSSSEVFTGIRWGFGGSGVITTNFHNGSGWVSTGLSGTPFSQGVTYTVDVYGNNSASTINYTYGTSQNIASNTFDLWVDGTLVGDDLIKSGLIDLSNIDSWMFYGTNSTSNVANIFVDNIIYTNTISSTPLPVELSSFSASRIDQGVQLNWTTQTEVNNYGFEIERTSSSTTPLSEWEKIGFVLGQGNSNSIKNYQFIDDNVQLNRYSYRLKQIDNDGLFNYSKSVQIIIDAAMNYELSQNYPNPFNPVTSIKFTLPETGFVRLELLDILGQKLRSVVNETKNAGVYTVTINLKDLNSGIYFYKLDVNGYTSTRKMNLLK